MVLEHRHVGVSQLEVFSQLEDLQSLLSQQAGSSDTLGFLHALLEFQLGMLGDTPQDAEKVPPPPIPPPFSPALHATSKVLVVADEL